VLWEDNLSFSINLSFTNASILSGATAAPGRGIQLMFTTPNWAWIRNNPIWELHYAVPASLWSEHGGSHCL
jgi:hypothetical protein